MLVCCLVLEKRTDPQHSGNLLCLAAPELRYYMPHDPKHAHVPDLSGKLLAGHSTGLHLEQDGIWSLRFFPFQLTGKLMCKKLFPWGFPK